MVFFTDFRPAVRTGIRLLFLTVSEETEEENEMAEGGLGGHRGNVTQISGRHKLQ